MKRHIWAAQRRAVLLSSLVFCALALAGAALAGRTAFDGLLWDAAVAARAHFAAPSAPASDVAVIALDARSLDAPELAELPRVLFAPHWATLLDALSDARAIGFDIIFAYSANRLIPDYERDFLAALDRLKHKIVLGRTLTTLPAMPYLFAAGALDDENAVAAVELVPDRDDIVRHAYAGVRGADGSVLRAFAAAMVARAGSQAAEETIMLPPRHPESIPTYGLAQVLRCAASDRAALRATFAGRLVLVGTTLPEEERKTTSARFMAPPPAIESPGGACDLAQRDATDPGSGAIPGVHAHAVAVEALWHGFAARPASAAATLGLTAMAALAGLALGFAAPPALAAIAVFAGLAGLFVLETFAAAQGVWLPAGLPMLALLSAAPFAFAVCSMLEGRLQRSIRAAFARYVSPLVVEKLVRHGDPKIGGTTREITVMFADLTGFTALSDQLSADRLLQVTNTYLAIMADEVEAGGGYVDKFIGDAVMAIWNAPQPDAQHALHATKAALRMLGRVATHGAAERDAGQPALTLKIAIHSGEAVVGNVGSQSRLNYTAVGRTVNVAARLERAGEAFGSAIVLSEATARLVGPHMQLRRLGEVNLRGINAAVALYAPELTP